MKSLLLPNLVKVTMARRRSGRPIHGWVIVDKPSGVTSTATVGAVRSLAGAAKAGHGGTLDPLATGVLPIALGEATKTIPYVVEGRKAYRFTVRWGEQRDTDDAEGKVVATSSSRPSEEAIKAILPRFTGTIEQIPPMYSAVKIEGRRAYALARADLHVDLPARTIVVDRIRLVDCPDHDHAVFEVESGKGAYMRALARDIAAALGTHGFVARLRRTAVGPFSEDAAIALDMEQGVGHSGSILEQVLPVKAALAGIPALALTEAEARRLQRGQAVAVLPVIRRFPCEPVSKDMVVCAMAEDRPVALAQIRGGEIRPLRILNL